MSIVDRKCCVEYPYSKKTVFDATIAAIKGMDIFELSSIDELSGHINMKAGVSWSSWGENIPIQITSVTPTRTRVEIISSPKTGILFGGANDFGKNRRNIEQIISAISAQLQGTPILTEESAVSTIYIADELLKLKQLKDAGILTDEEFDTQKKKLLGIKTPDSSLHTETSSAITSPTVPSPASIPPVKEPDPEKPNTGMAIFAIITIIMIAITIIFCNFV